VNSRSRNFHVLFYAIQYYPNRVDRDLILFTWIMKIGHYIPGFGVD